MLMMFLHTDKSIMHIGKNDFKSTYIYFPDVQTYRFHSHYQNLTTAGHILYITL